MKELKDLSAAEIGKMVNSREVSPTEVLDYFFERIKDYKVLNAFTYLKKEEAYEKAKEIEKELAAGKWIGPFTGVPFALKDFLPSKQGWINTHGGVECLTAKDAYDSEFCKAMESLGGIAIGKTNAPAFGFRGTTDNALYGPTHNPYDYDRNAGGSSGGSAAAVAAGLVPIAEGGDAGGSIRIPAAWCGCYGFKASWGRIPSVCRPDAWAASHPYCTPGGLTKNVDDAMLLYYRMSGFNERDPQCVGKELFSDYPKAPIYNRKNLSGVKVAITYDFGIFDSVDPEIAEAVEKTAKILEKAGATVTRLSRAVPYSLKYLSDLWCKHISVDSMLEFEEAKKLYGFDLFFEAGDQLPAEFRYWYEEAKKLTVFDFYEFNKVRTKLYDYFLDIFEGYDIILSPVTTCLPVKNSAVKGETKGPDGSLISFAETFLYNITGNPAASCPAGFSKDGLPLAVQIASKNYNDDLILATSFFLEKEIKN